MKEPNSSVVNLNKKGLKHLLTLQDFTKKEIEDMLELMTMLKQARKDNAVPQLFKNKSIGMIFEQPSTRTRISFEVAATLLGGHGLFLSPRDIHLGAKENLDDTARVLSRMLDIVMARVGEHSTVAGLAKLSAIPVVNALSDWLHPTQVLADVFTMKEHLPKGKNLSDLSVAFMGDATNVNSSLMFVCTQLGMHYKHIGPKKYLAPQEWRDIALENIKTSNGKLTITEDIEEVKGCDIIVTDSFYWFGQEDEKEERLSTFIPDYVVTKKLMDMAGEDALFMHCLPANDQREVTREVMDGDRSIIFDEAENRLTAEMAIIVYLTYPHFTSPSEKTLKDHETKIVSFLENL